MAKINYQGKYISGRLTKCDSNGNPQKCPIDCDRTHDTTFNIDVACSDVYPNGKDFYGDLSCMNLQVGDYVLYSDNDWPINAIYKVKRVYDPTWVECTFIKNES